MPPVCFLKKMNNALTLFELNHMIREILESTTEDTYWVQGELSEGRVGYGNHFYGELVQKNEKGDKLVAKARVTCWENIYNMLSLRFKHQTGESLRPGMQVLLKVSVSFHEQFGYSLNIYDIDPSFTLGDMARRRKEILRQLEADGTIDDNKTLPMPLLVRRIAIVSSATAAGYEDFCNQLAHNEYGFQFHTRLFPATMQGAHVEESMIAALEAIEAEAENWDVVVIIRGGGATSDLSDFDSYPLATCITQCALPVITGIGHERDETVLDYVAHTHLKTPTAVAAFLVNHMADTATHLEELKQRILLSARNRMQQEQQRVERYSVVFPLAFAHIREKEEHRLALVGQKIQNALRSRKEREEHRLQLLSQKLSSLDPMRLLDRGYSITLCGQRIVKDLSDLQEGDVLTTKLKEGEIYSKILLCKKK